MDRGIKDLYKKALSLLARREYSHCELKQKLAHRALSDHVDAVLQHLENTHALSDQRFAQYVTQNAVERGYGPLYIKNKLHQKGVHNTMIEHVLKPYGGHWTSLAKQQRIKHFGHVIPKDAKSCFKQVHYLIHRGFALEDIHTIFPPVCYPDA